MNSKALIKETLKYLETDENNQPKYRFDIYTSGTTKYLGEQLSNLTFGLIPNNYEDSKEEPIPVSVYTVGDLFDTFNDVTDDVMGAIQNLPDTLENIKVSLKQLGFQALDQTIEYIKAATIPIEVIQTVDKIYRIAKPLVQKIVNIASIRFHFENSALVAQDVLQYLTRFATQTAKNALFRLWNVFMDTPIFAVYENDDTIDLTEIYSGLSDAARDEIDGIARNPKAFGDILTYINNSNNIIYEPKYDKLGISIPDDIVDVYSDPHTRKIYIASEHNIYILNEDYSTKEILSTTDTIKRIYFYSDSIFYITGSTIKKNANTVIQTLTGNLDIIFSEPLLITNGTKIYTGAGTEIPGIITNNETLTHHCYDQEKDIIYYTSSVINGNTTSYGINTISKDEDYNYYKTKLSVLNSEPKDISYFNNSLYIVLNDSGVQRVYKSTAGFSYNKSNYNYTDYTVKNKNNIIWTDSKYATDNTNIFSVNNNELKYLCQAPNSINCITKYNKNNNDYFVCSGGDRLYASIISYQPDGTQIYKWHDKKFNTDSVENEINIEIPENMAGCLWFNNGYGDNFVVYSQEHIYTVGPDKIDQILKVNPPGEPKDLFLKVFVNFEDWYKDEPVEEVEEEIEYSSITSILDDCIITGIRVIDGRLYISLFSPKYTPSVQNITKSGVYPASIVKNNSTKNISTFVIDYDHPVFTLDYNAKIYSFNKYSDGWYYTDGDNFICPAKKTKTILDFEVNEESGELPDGALYLYDDKKIFTSQAVLTPVLSEAHTEISTIVDYQANSLDIASTKNVLMISDGEYVYNTFNNDGYDIASELFQICYDSKSYEYKMIQSNDAVFIVSGNVINKMPLYSELVSSNYGCGYYTDTTPNKWFGAAPYYFASNVLNSGKNNTQKDIYLLYFKQNFKVELEKLLRNIPDAFVEYTQSRLVDKLKKKGFSIDGDDGQILDLIINSVAATTSNSIGMYVQEKFAEKIGDDETYEQFATDVYNACRFDSTNNMTEDFYKIFEELYDAAIVDAINNMNLLKNGLANWLLRYYQNHKGEWAESMTSLIDIDTVDPEWYEIPLKANSVNIPKNTYKFTYDNNGGTYNFDYVSSPSAHYKEENIIEGYYYNGKFYSDAEHQELINIVTRDSETGNYYDADGDLICYYDSKNDRYCRYETEDYVLSEDTEIDLSKTYYEKTGTGIYTYTPTTDTEEDENKQYYSKSYGLTDDSFVIEDKVYLSKTAEEYKYERMPSNLPTYELGSYFEKLGYSLTEDTSISANKNYYVSAFTEATGEISSSTQYYKINYVPTTDLQIDPDKEYFEVIDLSNYVIGTAGTYFEYDPEAAEKYKVVFEQANTPFDSDQDYYTEVETDVYELVLDANEQGGPYYVISEFTRDDNNGTYAKKTFTNDTAKVYYSRVVNPTLNNLAAYYETTYVKIPTPTSLNDVYVLEYILVDEPNVSDISTYYEETDDTYVPAENISYNYDPETGNPVSINNDRNYYLRTYIPGVYYIIENPTGNPSQKGWYEYEYNSVMSGTFANPSAKGYYERSSSPIGFDVVPTIYIRTGEGTEQDPYVYTNINSYSPPQQYTYYVRSGSGTPEDPYVYTEETEWRAQDTHYVRSGSGTEQDPYVYHEVEELYFVHSGSGTEQDPYVWIPINEVSPVEKGWYELETSYSTLYDDKKLYIDLEPETIQSRFPDEDEDWHDMFYDSVLAAKVVVEQMPEEEAKAKALEELNKIQTKLMPSWLWQYLITESVSKYYIPKQGDQYRQIILDSNMYPIQWDELPDDIDHNSFDYALTALLYAIKQRLITNVTLLVDGGKVKCYSCVDAATVIQKMVNRNSVIWSNQIRTAKTKVTKANTKAEVLKAFDMIQMPEDSLLMLEEILNKQSGLYAKYIDMIIEEQVINDNTTEVSL